MVGFDWNGWSASTGFGGRLQLERVVGFDRITHNKEISGAGCTMTNDVGKWFVTSPGSTVVHKSTADMQVDCHKDGVGLGTATAVSTANGSVWGNIVAGGLIGYAMDASSGAGLDYPNVITVTLNRMNGGEKKAEEAPTKADKPAVTAKQ